MVLHAVELKITGLDWLYVKEEERYRGREDGEEVFEEARGRGSLILSEVLGLFPNLELLSSLPQIEVKHKVYVGCEVYRANDSSLSIVKFTRTIPFKSEAITGFNLLVYDLDEGVCRTYRERIKAISDSYSVEDSVHGPHVFESRDL